MTYQEVRKKQKTEALKAHYIERIQVECSKSYCHVYWLRGSNHLGFGHDFRPSRYHIFDLKKRTKTKWRRKVFAATSCTQIHLSIRTLSKMLSTLKYIVGSLLPAIATISYNPLPFVPEARRYLANRNLFLRHLSRHSSIYVIGSNTKRKNEEILKKQKEMEK